MTSLLSEGQQPIDVNKFICVFVGVCGRERERDRYGVDSINRLLEIKGLFAKYRLFCRALFQRRPIILIERGKACCLRVREKDAGRQGIL